MTKLIGLCLVAIFVSVSAEALPEKLIAVQSKLYVDAFSAFMRDMKTAQPALIGNDPIAIPAFDVKLSRNEWIGKFVEQVVSVRRLSMADSQAVTASAEKMFTSYYHDKGFSRVPYLQEMKASGKVTSIRSVTPVAAPKTYPGNHTLDVHGYVAERFPKPIQEFVQQNRVTLQLSDSNCDDAFAYEQSQGFSEGARFMAARDNSDSQFIFVYNPANKRFRLAICDIRGQDDATRMLAIVGPVFKDSKVEFIRHTQPAALLSFNEEGQALKFDAEKMRVIIGFQNTVWWQLKTSSEDWQRRLLTKAGVEVSIFENLKTRESLISVANVYGDEMTEAMQTLYKKGARRFVYLGTAGGLDPQYELGDLLIPDRFHKPDGSWFNFKNDGERVQVVPPAPAKRISATPQGWVGTLIHETKDFLHGLKSAGVGALDVEARYFAEFLTKHEASEKSVFIVVSDQPLGVHNYNNENATRDIPMKSINALIPRIVAQ